MWRLEIAKFYRNANELKLHSYDYSCYECLIHIHRNFTRIRETIHNLCIHIIFFKFSIVQISNYSMHVYEFVN